MGTGTTKRTHTHHSVSSHRIATNNHSPMHHHSFIFIIPQHPAYIHHFIPHARRTQHRTRHHPHTQHTVPQTHTQRDAQTHKFTQTSTQTVYIQHLHNPVY